MYVLQILSLDRGMSSLFSERTLAFPEWNGELLRVSHRGKPSIHGRHSSPSVMEELRFLRMHLAALSLTNEGQCLKVIILRTGFLITDFYTS